MPRQAVILAAGYGRGLEPITHTRHKALLPLPGGTLLSHTLGGLARAGVKRAVIVVHYLADQVIREAERVAAETGVDVEFAEQGEPKGTGHAALKGLERLEGGEALIINGDTYFSPEDLAKLATSGPWTVAAYEVEDPRRFGVLLVKGGVVRGVIEKPEEPPSKLVNAGAYVVRVDVFIKELERLQPSPRGEYEITDAVAAIAEKEGFTPLMVSEWSDVGRPWTYLDLVKRLLAGVAPAIKGEVSPNAELRGHVYVAEGAVVRHGTVIQGPAFIGPGADIGPNAFVRGPAMVLNGARVGFSVELKASIVMESAHAAHLSYIGDSVVCESANLGAGTVLANLRFDDGEVTYLVKGRLEGTGRRKFGAVIGGHAKTGVNTSVLPGRWVGAYSWTHPGYVVNTPIPPCTYASPGGLREVPDCGVDLSVWRWRTRS